VRTGLPASTRAVSVPGMASALACPSLAAETPGSCALRCLPSPVSLPCSAAHGSREAAQDPLRRPHLAEGPGRPTCKNSSPGWLSRMPASMDFRSACATHWHSSLRRISNMRTTGSACARDARARVSRRALSFRCLSPGLRGLSACAQTGRCLRCWQAARAPASNSGQARPKRGRCPARLRDLPLRQPGARGAVRHGRLARRDQLVEQRVCEHARQLAHLRPTQG